MILRSVGLATLLLAPVALVACGADDDATTANETLEDPTPVLAEVETPDPVPAVDAPAPEFGTIGEVGFAETLWSALEAAALVGDQPLHAPFYEGAEPHGFVLETIFAEISVSGTVAPVVVKRNYGPEGVAVGDVANDGYEFCQAASQEQPTTQQPHSKPIVAARISSPKLEEK